MAEQKIVGISARELEGLQWHTPPVCQGQIVTYSWAWTEMMGLIMRRYDASDRATSYYAPDKRTTRAMDLVPESYDPPNSQPRGTWDVLIAVDEVP